MLRTLLPAIAALAIAAPTMAAEPEMPAFMSGCWIEQGERWTEECWLAPRGGNMLGASRSGRGDRVIETENIRIDAEASGRIVYRAVMRTGGWTDFVRSASTDPGFTFVNAEHDYPQRIRYWREGPALLAEISLLDGSKARRWKYQRMGTPSGN